jgi:hypothetical protein
MYKTHFQLLSVILETYITREAFLVLPSRRHQVVVLCSILIFESFLTRDAAPVKVGR